MLYIRFLFERREREREELNKLAGNGINFKFKDLEEGWN